MFNVAIIGGQDTNDYNMFVRKCIILLQNKAKEGGITILTFGDDFVDHFAKKYGINTKLYNADWGTFGKQALCERNKEILNDCDAVIIFDNEKKDIQVLKEMVKKQEKPLRVIMKQ